MQAFRLRNTIPNTLGCVRGIAMASRPAAEPATAMKAIEELQFDNQALRELPVDTSGDRQPKPSIRGVCFSSVTPEPVQNPKLVVASQDALALLDIAPDQLDRPEFVEYFSGNRLLPGCQPAAHNYCGHQFGYFSGQLGDGAAMYLGEIINSQGQRWELQFKGAGLTPYSRAADGRKVLRSSVREFLCSEAMHYLVVLEELQNGVPVGRREAELGGKSTAYIVGIPTTRAGTCVTSDTYIVRDPLYDGNAIRERATIITRIAPTFLRFGSFEIFKATDSVTGRTGPSAGLEAELLPRMLHFTIKTYFPEIWQRHDGAALQQQYPVGNEAGWHPLYRDWISEVAVRTASLVAAWQSVGWCHGVLNTDNMSIIGVTIDYGPFGFLDGYNPAHVCNGSDDGGRYTYEAQPSICRWNISKLGEAVKWAIPERITKEALDAYDREFDRAYLALFRRKLGLIKVEDTGDLQLITDLLKVMGDAGSDWTNTWRGLARLLLPATSDDATPSGQQYEQLLQYLVAQGMSPDVMAKSRDTAIPASNLAMLMTLAQKDPVTLHALGTNPQQIAAEAAKAKEAARLRKMSKTEKEQSDKQAWTNWLQQYSKRLSKEAGAGATQDERVAVMNATNPRYVLRNWMAQDAIQQAERGNYDDVRGLLDLLRDPFTTQGEDAAFAAALQGDGEKQHAADTGTVKGDDYDAAHPNEEEQAMACSVQRKYDRKPPAWATKLCVTCSS